MNDVLRRLRQSLAQRLAPLTRRERIALGAVAAAACLGSIYLLLLGPSAAYLRDAQAREAQERELLAWVREREGAARALQANAPIVPADDNGESLLALASSTGKEAGLVFQRLEPGKDGRLTLWLSDTDFNALLGWLDHLVSGQRIAIERIALSQSSRAGAVEAQIVLSR